MQMSDGKGRPDQFTYTSTNFLYGPIKGKTSMSGLCDSEEIVFIRFETKKGNPNQLCGEQIYQLTGLTLRAFYLYLFYSWVLVHIHHRDDWRPQDVLDNLRVFVEIRDRENYSHKTYPIQFHVCQFSLPFATFLLGCAKGVQRRQPFM